MFAVGIYTTRAKAEAALSSWLDVYSEDCLSIYFDGSSYLLNVTLPDDYD